MQDWKNRVLPYHKGEKTVKDKPGTKIDSAPRLLVCHDIFVGVGLIHAR